MPSGEYSVRVLLNLYGMGGEGTIPEIMRYSVRGTPDEGLNLQSISYHRLGPISHHYTGAGSLVGQGLLVSRKEGKQRIYALTPLGWEQAEKMLKEVI